MWSREALPEAVRGNKTEGAHRAISHVGREPQRGPEPKGAEAHISCRGVGSRAQVRGRSWGCRGMRQGGSGESRGTHQGRGEGGQRHTSAVKEGRSTSPTNQSCPHAVHVTE